MPKYPTVQTTSKTASLFNQIRDRGKPDEITLKWLQAAGFKSSNDRGFIAVLKFLQLIDGKGAPTEKYDAMKRPTWKASLGTYVREAYSDIFKDIPNAHQRGREELIDEFRSHDSAAGSETINRAVSTFQALCAVAEFPDVGAGEPGLGGAGSASDGESGDATPRGGSGARDGGQGGQGGQGGSSGSNSPMSVTINISLELPPTENEDVYDKLFASMAKHIGALTRGTKDVD